MGAAQNLRNNDLVEPLDAEARSSMGGPDAHRVGAGAGMVGGTVAGAALGSVVAPGLGTVVGAAVGAIAGAFVGKGVAEAIDPTSEDQFWSAEYPKRPYHDGGIPYDQVRHAYRYGWESRARHPGRSFDEVEAELRQGWSDARQGSKLDWDHHARHAAKDAWDRVDERGPRWAEGDGTRRGPIDVGPSGNVR
jgi:hypothetical protein